MDGGFMPPLQFSSNPNATGGAASTGGITFNNAPGVGLYVGLALAGLGLVFLLRGK